MEIESDSAAVVVADMQNGFCHPDGSLYAPPSEEAIEPVSDLVEEARKNGVQVVFTRDAHPPEQFDDAHHYDEFERWGEHVIEGSWDAELIDEFEVRERDKVVVKHTYDPFYQTELEGFLESRGITELVICGTLANVCVFYTATSAGIRDYRPVVVEDALGYVEEKHKEYAVEHIKWLFEEKTTTEETEFV
jgi:nicotinamidase-related amidase